MNCYPGWASGLAMAALAASATASGAVTTIDFNGLAHGTVLPVDQYAAQGVTITLPGLPGVGPKIWGLNLATAATDGGVLWPATGIVAVDDGPFYNLQFDFATPIDYFSIVAIDTEEPFSVGAFSGSTSAAVSETRTFLANYSITNPYTGNSIGGDILQVTLGSVGGGLWFDRVVLSLDASGPEGWDNLAFNTTVVPMPPAMWLFVSALGWLGFSRRSVGIAS